MTATGAGGQVSELQQLVAAGAPGAAGWVQNEGGRRGAASGLADLRTHQPMRPELRFRAGSLTRSLVATAVLGLAAEGRLRWPTPWSAAWPALPSSKPGSTPP